MDIMYTRIHRILVLECGRIVEDGPPRELLSDRKFMFHSMAKEAGV